MTVLSNRSAAVLGGVFPPVSYALAALLSCSAALLLCSARVIPMTVILMTVLGGVLQLSAQPPSYYAQPESFR
ncbi:MAG TPA: hypothetical protein VIK64_04375 [Anaerolineales bacterium]